MILIIKGQRDRSIDFMKSLLVIFMIIAHSIQFLGNMGSKIQYEISNFVNLTTFPGFMFCFGYVSNIAYLKKNKDEVIGKLIVGSIKTLIVFYISGISYKIFVSQNLTVKELIKVLLLYKIPGYSEFLLAFFMLNIIILLFFNFFKRILEDNNIFTFVIIISLLSTFIPYRLVKISHIGIILGTTEFTCFPILQYISYFMFGLYFSNNKIKFNRKFFIVFFMASISFNLYKIFTNQIPLRFPPSFIWVIGASWYIYIYYLVSIYLSNKFNISKYFYFIGENTLYFLLISNIILFILKNSMPALKLNLVLSVIVALIVFIITYNIIISFVVYKLKLKNNEANVISK